ncbi:P-loop containing nucleoside triphosphate hydrolase protein [Peniophora sp. CONT]|nr:P-loop containing nucleoside triphosphate hydrolase protein [Peniophora sp. CONT]
MKLQVNAVRYTALSGYYEFVWRDARLVPAYVAAFSVAVLLIPALHAARRSRLSGSSNSAPTEDMDASHKSIRTHIATHGGITIFAFKLVRTACVLALLALYAFESTRNTDTHTLRAVEQDIALALTITYLYASALAVLDITSNKLRTRVAKHHLTLILLAGFAVYAGRDIWPLMTYTLDPVDPASAPLWVQVSLLTIAGIVIPLIIPRRYILIDPKNASEKPNPEQTCSILSLLMYSFLDKTVFAASQSTPTSLPEIADYDRSAYLVERNFKYLDVFSGARKQHVFFALMRVFRWEYVSLAVLMVLRAITLLLAPVGINRLLAYLESDGENAVVRPWVWCLVMFLGPFAGAIVTQYSNFVTTATLVRAEAMLTQLIFEHALRMRVKSEPTSATEDKKGDDLSGKLNNLVTSDLQNIVNGRDFLVVCIFTPTTVAISLYFLYGILGWSAFVGLAVMLACLPLPTYLTRTLQTVHRTLMQKTDARVQTVTEILGALKMVKMFGWEGKMFERLDEKREEELRWLRFSSFIELGNDSVTLVIPVMQMTATYVVFTVVMGGKLTPSIVFPSMSVFMLLRQQIGSFFYFASPLIKAKVSLDRITDFLRDTELLDQHASEQDGQVFDASPSARPSDEVIGIRDASFTWSTASSSPNAFALRVPNTLTFQRGKINLITGSTGCGKTSLLMALLGEMHFAPSAPGAYVSLPRASGVAYAAQESWVMSGTIRDNILFGAPYDATRFRKVIYQCGLKRDLSLFPAGDRTEVGEKGQTLSGGQKARITLARAIYSSAEILLLDDVLAALDVLTAKWIVGKCFKGELVRGRTVLLVTQNVALVGPIADLVVAFGSGGEIVARSSHAEVLAKDSVLAAEEKASSGEDNEVENLEDDEGPEPEFSGDGKLVVEEVVAKGHISSQALMLFWTSLGGDHPILFWVNFVIGMLAYRVLANLQPFWMGRWADAYTTPGSVNVTYYLIVFLLLVVGTVLMFMEANGAYVFGVIRSAKRVHGLLMHSILGTTLRWVDSTPSSRIITRCTKDIKAIDGQLAFQFKWLVSVSAQLIVQLVAIVLVTPAMLLPGLLILGIGAWVGNIYIKAQLPVKREMSNKKAPVLGHFSAAIAGLVSIRAYGAQDAFRCESYRRIDEYTRVGRTLYSLSCWVSLRSDTLGALLSSALGLYMVYGPSAASIGASNAGFALAMAAAFSQLILWLVRVYNDFEVEGNSLERIQAYLEIEQELKPTLERQPPASWPTSGELHVEGLSARYSPDGPAVLHDLSFTVRSGERVGIVGRTGSGKSSLTLSLLRCISTEGSVYFDGVDTANLNLDELRAKITIIPQVPQLLSGTLRENLDPFGEYDDAVLNSALRASGLLSLQGETDESRITLDSQLASGGGNLSIGQRQILALARALVRGSKLLILDEATSSIDHETDTIIQSSLRKELGSDVTLLTVAHRLQTIMDADKIMVLDAGRIVEFDSPRVLLEKSRGYFRSLVDESGDKDALYAMAFGE